MTLSSLICGKFTCPHCKLEGYVKDLGFWNEFSGHYLEFIGCVLYPTQIGMLKLGGYLCLIIAGIFFIARIFFENQILLGLIILFVCGAIEFFRRAFKTIAIDIQCPVCDEITHWKPFE